MTRPLALFVVAGCAGTDRPAGSDADSDVDTDVDTDVDSDVDTDSDTGTSTDTETDTDSGTGTGTGTDTDTDTGSDTGECEIDCGGGEICCISEWGEARCVNPEWDWENCGGCDVVCGDGSECMFGDCACAKELSDCGGECVSTSSDERHCGGCDVACEGDTPLCVRGACDDCEAGGLTTCDGACVDLGWTDLHCGACDTACGADEACVAGACALGLADCGDCGDGSLCCAAAEGDEPWCVEPRWEREHCGACGNVCWDGAECMDGVCQCFDETVRCGDECVSTDWDERHCGGCDSPCGAGAPLCRFGECSACADGGLTECGGVCVDTDWSWANCGACGAACGDDQACVAGGCVDGVAGCDPACGPRDMLCCPSAKGGDEPWCTGPRWDDQNCGGCGTLCEVDLEFCQDGVCTPWGEG